jgi:hypothetical protein
VVFFGLFLHPPAAGAVVRRETPGAAPVSGAIAWAQVLYQSVTSGGAISLELAAQPGGLD